jgi:hypothetical protein
MVMLVDQRVSGIYNTDIWTSYRSYDSYDPIYIYSQS